MGHRASSGFGSRTDVGHQASSGFGSRTDVGLVHAQMSNHRNGMWGSFDSYKQQEIGCGLSNQPRLITQLPAEPTTSIMPASNNSLRAPSSYNQRRSSTARNNTRVPYPYYQDVYARSIDPAGDNGFPDLDLQDFLVATRRIGRRRMARLRMTDHNSELLSRGLQARMDDREDRNPVVDTTGNHFLT